MIASIGILLTSFRRPHTLAKQLAAIRGQSISSEVVVWHNDGGVSPDLEAMRGCRVIAANYNTGVWPRFAFCLWGLSTPFVVVLDDDTIPGPNWLAHLLSCHSHYSGLYVENGVRVHGRDRSQREYIGWANANENLETVDYGGHAWFLERHLLSIVCGLPRPKSVGDTCGEDMHLSFALRRHGIPTLVAPHPAEDRSVWGSTNGRLGDDSVALWKIPGEDEKKNAAFAEYATMQHKLPPCDFMVTA